MKFLTVLVFFISMNAFSIENDIVFRQYHCESSDTFFEFYFDGNHPDLNTVSVAVKVKDTQNTTGVKYLVKDASYQKIANSNGVPCIDVVTYNAIQTDMTIKLNFCDGQHEATQIFSTQTTTSKLKCKFL